MVLNYYILYIELKILFHYTKSLIKLHIYDKFITLLIPPGTEIGTFLVEGIKSVTQKI